tara:strand:+ start:241 stop:510 length:270 start_codon:yes stop_codon:yes gene_type:complete
VFINIKKINNNKFKVVVKKKMITEHIVILPDETLKTLTKNLKTKEELLKFSFEFLLEKEENTSILKAFELSEISKYFPDFFYHIEKWIK